MSSKNLWEIPKLIDLAFGTPEIGVVNFNMLHALLHLMIKEMFNLEQNRIELIQKLDGTFEAILHDHIKSQQSNPEQNNSILSINITPSNDSKFPGINKKISVLPTADLIAPIVYDFFEDKGSIEKNMVIFDKSGQMKSNMMGSQKSKSDVQNKEFMNNKSQSAVKSSETKMVAPLKHEPSKTDSTIKSENLGSKSEALIQKSKNSDIVIENSNQEFEIKKSSMSQSKSSSTRIGGGNDQDTSEKNNTIIKSKSSTTIIDQIENDPISNLKTSMININQIEENADQISVFLNSKISEASTEQINEEFENSFQLTHPTEKNNKHEVSLHVIHDEGLKIDTHITKHPEDVDYKLSELNDDSIKMYNEESHNQNKVASNMVLNESFFNQSSVEINQSNEGNNSNRLSQVNSKEIITKEQGGQHNVEEDKTLDNNLKFFFTKSNFSYGLISPPIREKAGQDKSPNSKSCKRNLNENHVNWIKSREKTEPIKKTENSSAEPEIQLQMNKEPAKSVDGQLVPMPLEDSDDSIPASPVKTVDSSIHLLTKSLQSRIDKVEYVIKDVKTTVNHLNIELKHNFQTFNDRIIMLGFQRTDSHDDEFTLNSVELRALMRDMKNMKEDVADFKGKVKSILNETMKDVAIHRGLEEKIMYPTPQHLHQHEYFDNKFEELVLRNVELNQLIKDLEKQICGLNSMLLNYVNEQREKTSSSLNLIELHNELKAIKDFSDNVLKELIDVKAERDEFKELTDSIKKNIEFLNNMKLDKEEMDELLMGKADCTLLDRKLSIESYDSSRKKLEIYIKGGLDQIGQLNMTLKSALQTFNEQLNVKMEQSDLEKLREWVETIFTPEVEQTKKKISDERDNEAAATKARYLKNVECLSCEKNVLMQKAEKTNLPFLSKACSIKSSKPERTYKLDAVRTKIKGIPVTKNLNEFNSIMKKSKVKNRYCGGSHTKISNADNKKAGIGQGSATETTKGDENVICTCKFKN